MYIQLWQIFPNNISKVVALHSSSGCEFNIYLFYLFIFLIFFWLCRVLVAPQGIFAEACEIFHYGARSPPVSLWLWFSGFSLVVVCGFSLSSCCAWGSGVHGLCSCGMQVLLRRTSSLVAAHWLSCPVAFGILVPQPGIEPTSPALEGRFFTTGSPGKSWMRVYILANTLHFPSFLILIAYGGLHVPDDELNVLSYVYCHWMSSLKFPFQIFPPLTFLLGCLLFL